MVTATIQIATKELIDGQLSANNKNRNVRSRVVGVYETEIKSGKWLLTNQGIGVSESGQLIDGQHRLMAIRNCGYPPVPLLVVRGLSDEVRLVVDQQAKRSIRDALYFSMGERVAHHSPAICRALFYYGDSGSGRSSTPSVHQIIDILEANMDEIDAVVSAPKNSTMFAAAHLAAFVHVIKSTGRTQDVVAFMQIVENGENMTRKMPSYHLRNYVINNRSLQGGSMVQQDRFLKTCKATMAHLNGEEMGVLRS